MQLAARQKDGVTLREHLQRLYVNTGRLDPLLVPVPVPAPTAALWDAFLSLARTRQTGFGDSPLTPCDIEAWCHLNGVCLTPWEYDTITALDIVCLAAQQEHRRNAQ